MLFSLKLAAVLATVAVTAATTALPASAACTRLGFSVNDYGKDGPTKDAKDLLDKYIAKQMAERGIKSYKTGTKSVKCDLFLDFIVFDEHTCRAEATVCWDGAPLPKSEVAATSSDAPAKPAAAKPAAAKAQTAKTSEPKKALEPSSTATGSITKKAPEAAPAATPAADAAKAAVEPAKVDAPKPAAQ